MTDIQFHPVKKVKHYNLHPSGVECIEIVRHLSFGIGNAVKYVWRASNKGTELYDLEKSLFYLDDEIAIPDEEVSFYLGGAAKSLIALAQRYADAEECPDRGSAVLHLVEGALVIGEQRREHLAQAREHILAISKNAAPAR